MAVLPVGDVNGDGLTDLIHDRYVLLNAGGGTFTKRDLGLSGSDSVVEWIDVNGDGRADLLTGDRPMNGPGITPAARKYRIYIAGNNLNFGTGFPLETGDVYVPYVADVNADGKEDIVMVRAIEVGPRTVASEVKILLSRGDGTFRTRPTFRIPKDPQFGRTRRLLARDLDRDGRPDLVIRTAEELVVLRGRGNGDFAPAERRYIPYWPFGGWTLELVDVDNDGNLDLLMPGFFRYVRVLLGDGRGNFPRTSAIQLRQYRPYPVFTGPFEIDYDTATSPRNFAIGQFVRNGRTEIAVGTYEGDLVVLAWENGKLREVGRMETEYKNPDLHLGAFRQPGKNDLYITWNDGYGANRPMNRLLYAEPGAALAQASPAGRGRAVRGWPSQEMKFDVQMAGSCAPEAGDRWTLARDGMFGVDEKTERTVEAVLENDSLSFRFTAPWTASPIAGSLTRVDGTFTGTVEAETTTCGWVNVQITARQR
jgi:hypothetical protein